MTIPRIFHSFWTGPPMPEHLATILATWTRLHSGWEHQHWTDETLPPLVNQGIYDHADTIAPGSEGQLRADVARYEVLHRYGGVWVDCDLECLKPIDGLIHGLAAFAAWEVDGVYVNNAFLGCVPEHPFMADLIAELPVSVRANRGRRPNRMTGPHFVTPIHYRHPDVVVLPQQLVYPYSWDQVGTDAERGPFPNAYTAHRWENARKRKGIPLGA